MYIKIALLAVAAASGADAFAPSSGHMGLRSTSMQAHSSSPAPNIEAVSRRSFFGKGAAAGVVTTGLVQSAFAATPAIDAPAPDFELPSNRDKSIGLKDLKGKWTVLYFYPGDFTSGCTIEAQNFEKNAPKIRDLGAEIVGVSVDSAEKHLDFAKKYGLSFPLLSDKGGKVSDSYGSALKLGPIGTFSNRQTYLIDPSGTLKYVFTDVQSKIQSHAEDVVAKLTELTKA